MRLLSLLVLASIPVLSSCTFGAASSDIWASPDSGGQRHWTVFPVKPPSVNCVARYSAGTSDRTVAIGIRRCGGAGTAVCPAKTTYTPPAEGTWKDTGAQTVIALSQPGPTAVGAGQVITVAYAAVDGTQKAATLTPGLYQCFLVATESNESNIAALIASPASYEVTSEFVVSTKP